MVTSTPTTSSTRPARPVASGPVISTEDLVDDAGQTLVGIEVSPGRRDQIVG
ncbi:hypothetical protein BZL30_3904 [Mycobacterium kansasii]|uniref:Uncharacterized protein n=1 Tax=Mycobacterium kansasii TaxID=1768 RepID=A0A1V3X854_MYCKA|nr:hypothetical protein BZL30_3904 [Mycobacterium kansasii]